MFPYVKVFRLRRKPKTRISTVPFLQIYDAPALTVAERYIDANASFRDVKSSLAALRLTLERSKKKQLHVCSNCVKASSKNRRSLVTQPIFLYGP